MNKNKVICGILILAMTMFGFACKNDGGKDVNHPSNNLSYKNVVAPNPLTTDNTDLSKTDGHPDVIKSTINNEVIVCNANVMDFGAKADGVSDDSTAITSALNEVSSQGGGIVFMPAGNYMVKKQIIIPSNTTLRGECISGLEDGFEEGTTIFVGVGKGNSSVKPENAFIRVCAGSKLSNMNIYYPDQNADSPSPYPYTVAHGGYLGYSVENVNLINPYRGFEVVTHNVVLYNNIVLSPIVEGFFSDVIYDIPRYENITITPDLWTKYEEVTSGTQEEEDIKKTVKKATGLRFGKIDWGYIYNINISGINKGIVYELSTNGSGSFNGQVYNTKMTDVDYGYYFDSLSGVGVSIAYADIDAKKAAVYSGSNFNYPAQAFFNHSTFASDEVAVNNVGDGALMFTDCTFTRWGESAFDNSTYGYVNADNCTFTHDDSLIAHIGQNVVNSTFTNNTYASFPTLYNESVSENVFVDDFKVSEKIPSLQTQKDYSKEKYKAKKEDVYFASDFGVVADGSLLDCSSATDNSIALQKVLNCAGNNGGGIVYLGVGNYYIKDYIVIPDGVELRGSIDTNHHFGIEKKGTVLVTGQTEGSEEDEPLVTLLDNAGITGLNVFYLDQNHSNNKKYSPTIYVHGKNAFIYNVTLPDSYTGVLVHGDNVYIDYLRGLGLKACLVLEDADNSYIENIMLTGGDWQDFEKDRVFNAPPSDWWTNFPNYFNEGIYIADCDNTILMECFSFGMGSGLHLDGNVNNLISIGLGVDAAKNSFVFDHYGKNNIMFGNEFVGSTNYVLSTEKFAGEVILYGSAGWYGSADVRLSLNGTGKISFVQVKISTGGFDVNSAHSLIQNAVFDYNMFTMVNISDKAKGYIINSLGTLNKIGLEGSSSSFVTKNIGKR